ncbi:alcohol dehydrogenase [Rathayibacter oskolensis]|uniref:Alcohol dehydrogenase n=1 Tax=Rathayibacter oskolensis TaxID=1891671 RepID=A0A1X7PE01_9MICO|nr:iron-containing alcohol dehydrogenase [Rathayibacter oskolensis]SMH49013.1 alcohol dehydrogenase [Rathayibacter oskolensis]
MSTHAARQNSAPTIDASPPLFAALRAPRELVFGAGQRAALEWIAPRLGGRAFVCVDPFFETDPEFTALLALLDRAGVAHTTFSGVVPELPTASIMAAVDAARAAGSDLFIAVGGGSCIDLAKVVACIAAHGGEPRDYYGEFKVPGPILPLIAVPTTAGTGSEVTPVAVLTDPERATKVGISSPHLIPVAAICDPELTVSCPPGVTASAGADALAHCIEAYTSVRRAPDADLAGSRVFVGRGEITDAFCLQGISAIAAGLLRAYTTPDDIHARALVMYGSLMGGLAFGTAGTAAAHALQYPIGALTGTPHGVGVGLLLPYVMEFNRAHRVAEFAEIARRFGGEGDDEGELAEAAPRLVQEFLARVGVPTELGQIGFDPSRLDWALEQGRAAVRLSENNPRAMDDSAGSILRGAEAGTLSTVGGTSEGNRA